MSVSQPPLYQPLADNTGRTTVQWALFFSQLYSGDTGTAWIPAFDGLTSSGGGPSFGGRVYQISQSLVFFRGTVIPASGGNTSAVVGTTNITNFPFTMKGDGIVFAVAGKEGTGSGMCEQSSNLIWTPAWTTVSTNVSLIGIVEAS
ncbi:MAG: hypothetical protein KGL39_17865 [Patescibacteria group bacterium]|nr:hypothetical protein [Patescibacteria group bacterium]